MCNVLVFVVFVFERYVFYNINVIDFLGIFLFSFVFFVIVVKYVVYKLE